jgi:hypothetical protein
MNTSRNRWRLALGIAALLCWATFARAQGTATGIGYWKSVTAPVFAGGPFTGQLTGPGSTCANPAYAFTGSATTGLGSDVANAWCLSANGVAQLRGTTTAVTSTVPILGPNGTAGAPSFSFANDADTGFFWPSNNGSLDYSAAGTATVRLDDGIRLRSAATLEWSSGAIGAASDVFLAREAAAVLQMGGDAAGVTDQMFKGPDRITSDGVGGNLTIAGGRNRGASAGGSIIFQTSPAAGAGVTGTLATALTIDSTKLATFAAGVVSGAHVQIVSASYLEYAARSLLKSPANGQLNLTNNADAVGIGLDFTVDGTVTIRNRAQNDNAILRASVLGVSTAYQVNGTSVAISVTAPTVANSCTGEAMVWNNGTAAFEADMGTTCAGVSTVVFTLPAAANAWVCTAMNVTTSATAAMEMTASTTTTATFTNYTRTTGVALAFVDGANVRVSCLGG